MAAAWAVRLPDGAVITECSVHFSFASAVGGGAIRAALLRISKTYAAGTETLKATAPGYDALEPAGASMTMNLVLDATQEARTVNNNTHQYLVWVSESAPDVVSAARVRCIRLKYTLSRVHTKMS